MNACANSNSLYCTLLSWQPLIGSVTALVALISAALFNFWLNRKRDDALRREETISIASAFYGEMTAIRQEAARVASIIARFDQQNRDSKTVGSGFADPFLQITQLPPSSYFDHLKPKVGVLPPAIALGVIRFYQRIERARTWIPALAYDPKRDTAWSSSGALRPLCQVIEESGATLLLLEKLIGLENFLDPLERVYDLGEASLIVETEDRAIDAARGDGVRQSCQGRGSKPALGIRSR